MRIDTQELGVDSASLLDDDTGSGIHGATICDTPDLQSSDDLARRRGRSEHDTGFNGRSEAEDVENFSSETNTLPSLDGWVDAASRADNERSSLLGSSLGSEENAYNSLVGRNPGIPFHSRDSATTNQIQSAGNGSREAPSSSAHRTASIASQLETLVPEKVLALVRNLRKWQHALPLLCTVLIVLAFSAVVHAHLGAVESLRSEVESMRKELREGRARNERTESDLLRARSDLLAANSALAAAPSLRDDVDRLGRGLRETRADNERLESEVRRIRTDLLEAVSASAEAGSAAASVRDDVNILRGGLAECVASGNRTESELGQAWTRINAISAESTAVAASLQSDIASLRASTERIESELQTVQAGLDESASASEKSNGRHGLAFWKD